MTNDFNDSIAKLLQQDEQYRRLAYIDSQGEVTAGIGRNMSQKGLSLPESLYLLNNDVQDSINDARKALSNFDSLSFNQRLVIVSMVFNLGLTRFLSFKKMIAAILTSNYTAVPVEMLDSKWHDEVGDRAERLAKLWES